MHREKVRVSSGWERRGVSEAGEDEWYDGMRPSLFLLQHSARWRQPLAISWNRSVLHAYIELLFSLFIAILAIFPLKSRLVGAIYELL